VQSLGMPRGRPHQTAAQARDQTLYKLLSALVDHPDGLRFKDWSTAAGVHTDTVSARLPELIEAGLVRKEDKFYKITDKVGVDELDKSSLLKHINESREFASYGGESPMVVSAFPPLPVTLVPRLGNYVEQSLMAFWLQYAASRHWIDARYLTGELPVNGLVDELRRKLPRGVQVLAFSMNYDRVRSGLSKKYVSQILTSFKNSEWGRVPVPERLVMESRALEFLRQKKRVELTDAAEHLEMSIEEAEHLLDGLVDWGASTTQLSERDEQGNPKVVGFPLHLTLSSINPFLTKTEVRKRKYYSPTDAWSQSWIRPGGDIKDLTPRKQA